MGKVTINNAAIDFDFEPLEIDFNMAGSEVNIEQLVSITNGYITGGSNPFSFSYPPGLSIVQPFVWNPVGGTPDKINVLTAGLLLGTGATGTLVMNDLPADTPASLPASQALLSSGTSSVYSVGVTGFTPGTSDSAIALTMTIEDTVAGLVSPVQNVLIRFKNP